MVSTEIHPEKAMIIYKTRESEFSQTCLNIIPKPGVVRRFHTQTPNRPAT
ncbi:hypothetical protein RRSWK_03987 [Rhodopirellula sp. SWK7]|nr:hypothetical protein RRSWK_03987 [Rhodopirellula sp. SWK7]